MTDEPSDDIGDAARHLSHDDIEFLHDRRRRQDEYREIRKNVIGGVVSGLVLSTLAAVYGAVKWFLAFIVQTPHKPL